MLTVLICAFIGFLYAARRPRKNGYNEDFFDRYIGPFIAPTMLGAFVGFFLGVFITFILPTHVVVAKPISLVSMRSIDGVGGTFVFGSGAIGNSGSYGYYVRHADGTLVPASVPADDVAHIREDANLHGVAYLTITTRGPDKNSLVAKYFAFVDHSAFEVTRREFHVPAGTVVQDFRVQ